MRRERLGS